MLKIYIRRTQNRENTRLVTILKTQSTLDRMDQMLKVMWRTALMIIDHFQIAHFHLEKLYIQRNLEQLQILKNLLILKELLEKIFITD